MITSGRNLNQPERKMRTNAKEHSMFHRRVIWLRFKAARVFFHYVLSISQHISSIRFLSLFVNDSFLVVLHVSDQNNVIKIGSFIIWTTKSSFMNMVTVYVKSMSPFWAHKNGFWKIILKLKGIQTNYCFQLRILIKFLSAFGMIHIWYS